MAEPQQDDLQLKIALSMLRCVTAEMVRKMDEAGISPADFMVMPAALLAQRIGLRRTDILSGESRRKAVEQAAREVEFIRRHNIRARFLLDDDYPARLKECHDAPVILYSLGEGSLSTPAMAAVVGTRRPTDYGKEFCGHLIKGLQEEGYNATIVSGLAYGIDAAAHRAALSLGLPTIAVVAHGLDTIYPASHRKLAADIIAAGGAIVTEYPSQTRSLRGNFLARNRIIAGLCDVTAVIESALRGGALSTAASAFAYNRDVMALPGRVTDELSAGCLALIESTRAAVLRSAADMIKAANWDLPDNKPQYRQPELPLIDTQEGATAQIIEVLRRSETALTADEIHASLLLPMPEILAMLTEMEFDGLLIRHPGNRYSLPLF